MASPKEDLQKAMNQTKPLPKGKFAVPVTVKNPNPTPPPAEEPSGIAKAWEGLKKKAKPVTDKLSEVANPINMEDKGVYKQEQVDRFQGNLRGEK